MKVLRNLQEANLKAVFCLNLHESIIDEVLKCLQLVVNYKLCGGSSK
jgi:hypothetical protein